MPRLPTLLLTLTGISAGLAPVLSLDSGFYRICHKPLNGEALYLTSLYGDYEEIQMLPLRSADVTLEQQLWYMNLVDVNAVTLKNVKYNCEVVRGSNAFQNLVPLCLNGHSSTFNLTLIQEKPSVYHIDWTGEEPRRMHYDELTSPNVTFTYGEDPTPFIPYTKFIFERVTEEA
ncbi:unnamed protein product [Rhizoctonia solani]|uniref:Ricin B lectin domain-containing protein n=1 Tax=Rhizoctonia solani TaxID=456999 RepID=A0A8H3BIR3_9AGAM|nr:unnamed protein product [Rhizoctonia solani]